MKQINIEIIKRIYNKSWFTYKSLIQILNEKSIIDKKNTILRRKNRYSLKNYHNQGHWILLGEARAQEGFGERALSKTHTKHKRKKEKAR